MKLLKMLPVALAGTMMLTACQTGPKAGLGTLGGAVAGGLIGTQIGKGRGRTTAIIAGSALGALLGGQLGSYLDNVDRQRASAAEYGALSTGRAQGWSNPNSGHYGQVVPGPTYTSQNSTCREYSHTIYIDGRPNVAKGVACRQSDGTWQIVS